MPQSSIKSSDAQLFQTLNGLQHLSEARRFKVYTILSNSAVFHFTFLKWLYLMINSFSIGHTANFLRSFDIGVTSIMVEKFWEFGFGLQAWLLDQFGVVHDGKQPYPGAISTCMFYQLAFDVWERYFMSLFVTLFLSSEW